MAQGSSLTGPVLIAGAGSLLLYSGIKGKGFLSGLRGLLHGQAPSTAAAANPISSGVEAAASTAAASVTLGSTGASDPGAAQNQATAKMLAISMGHADWTTGQQWSDWLKLWNQESGWSITAANPTSDARGIAQNINGYGPDYLEGNAQSQITWGINYISQRYGSPSAAWTHEVANNWY